MLHHFFECHGHGESKVHLHADNCTGQNKNRFMMFYLMWRVLVGLHKEITISFLFVGHTKFSPDWCFGLFKQLYRKTKVGSIHDIAEVVKQSANVNHPQLIGDYDGTTYVKIYDWQEQFFWKPCNPNITEGHLKDASFSVHGGPSWLCFCKELQWSGNGNEDWPITGHVMEAT